MSELVAQLRDHNHHLTLEAAALIESLQARTERQQILLDKSASTLFEAVMSDDGIDSTIADELIEAILEDLGSVGKTTTEEMLERLYSLIGSAAGLPPSSEFDPKHVLDQMRTCIAVQTKNGDYLEFLLRQAFWKTPDNTMRLRLFGGGQQERFMTFAAGTAWPEALDAAMVLPPQVAHAA